MAEQSILNYISDLEGKYNIPSGAFKQIVQQESSFKPNLTSSAGAYGYAQLMPKTAQGLGVDRYNPMENLEGGAKYYSQLLDKSGGDTAIAAGMYNSGPNKAAYKTGQLNLLPVETQKYIQNFKASFKPNTMMLEDLLAKGAKFEDAGPKPLSVDDLLAKGAKFEEAAQPEIPAKVKSYEQAIPDRTVSQALGEAVSNIPSSLSKNLEASGQAIMHPVDTATALDAAIMGSGINIPGIKQYVEKNYPEIAAQYSPAFEEMKKTLSHRYGGSQEALNTLATDPVGMISDLSTVGGVLNLKKLTKNIVSPLSSDPAIKAEQIANPSTRAKAVNLVAGPVTNLITSPIPTVAGGVMDVSGKLGKEFLSAINRSGISKADIEAAYQGLPGSVSKQPFIPENISGTGALLGLLGATSLTPASLLALSPKAVAAGANVSGKIRKTGKNITGAYESIPMKGLLREYGTNTQDKENQ